MKPTAKNIEDKKPITTFRCPRWMRQIIDRKVMEQVINNSTNGTLFRYTRTDLILDAIRKCYDIQDDGGIE